MSLYTWLTKRSKTRRSRSKSRRDQTFRPSLEPLEARLVLTTRTWTGGSILSNHWSDQFNWQNGVPQVGDSVFFPAAAKQRTNVQDIVQFNQVGVGLTTL